MNVGGHLVTAAVSWVGYCTYLTGSWTAVGQDVILAACLPIALFGGLLPDIDHPDSTFGRKVRPLSSALSLFSHRGITHSIWAIVALLWVIGTTVNTNLIWVHAVIVGYLSHLLADAITPAGIRPLWPLPWTVRVPVYGVGVIGIVLFGFAVVGV